MTKAKSLSIKISDEDQIYVLSEALGDFLEKVDPKHWRAVEAAQALNMQVNKARKSLQAK